MIDMLDYAKYLNKIYDKKGFHSIIELVKSELEYGNVSFRNGLYCITTGGWSDDESLVHALISPVCRFHYHYCGYIVGGAFFFVEDKDCKNDVEMLNTMNQRYYKVVADNLGEYSILTNDDILLVTEIQDRVIAETVNEELNCIAVNADYHMRMHDKFKKEVLQLSEKNKELMKENKQLKSDNKSYVKRYGELFDEYTKLKEENKELKKLNSNLQKSIDYQDETIKEQCHKLDWASECGVRWEEEYEKWKGDVE